MIIEPDLLAQCANRLDKTGSEDIGGPADGAADAFLKQMGLHQRHSDAGDLAVLLRAASRLDAVFQMPSPDAPGLSVFGARVVTAVGKTVGVNGIDFTPARAFAKCIGEAVETLAVFSGNTNACSAPASEGCAAGPDRDAAGEAALLELIERDALALWWFGGQPAGRLGPGELAAAEFADLKTRSGITDSVSMTVIRLQTDLPVIVVAACILDEKGLATCFGFSARSELVPAVRGACLEAIQSKLALDLAQLRMRHDAVSGSDDCHANVRRFVDGMKMPECADYRSLSWPAGDRFGRHGLSALLGACEERGFAVEQHDLTQPDIGIPVMRMVSPDLQPSSARPVRPRLQRALGAGNYLTPEQEAQTPLM